jgi:ribosomal protein S18 acetylase RimI-like enzyme
MNLKHTHLIYKKVENEEEAELLRRLRNQCKEYMTRNTNYITSDEQKEWFRTAGDKYDLYLVYALEYGAAVTYAGYGVIHKNTSESLLTGGLVPEYRNQGLGQHLFQFLIDSSRKDLPIRLEVLKTNSRAHSVYVKLGFEPIFENDKIIIMEHKYDSVI